MNILNIKEEIVRHWIDDLIVEEVDAKSAYQHQELKLRQNILCEYLELLKDRGEKDEMGS